MKRWQIFLLAILALTLIGGAGYFGFQGSLPFNQSASPETVEAPPVVEVTQGNVKQTVINPGQLASTKSIDIPAEISGEIEAVHVRPGDTVKAGDVLVEIGGREQLEANVVAARIALLKAQSRLDELHANADLREAEALQAISDAQRALDDLSINAPIQQSEALQAVASAQKVVRNAEYRLSILGATEAALTTAQADVTLATQRLINAESDLAPHRDKPDDNYDRAIFGAAWAAAKRDYDAAVNHLNALKYPSALTRTQREAELEVAQAQLAQAEATYAGLTGGIDPEELGVAEAKLALAGTTYAKLEDGVDPAELIRAEADIEKARLDLKLAEARLDAPIVTAPFDGVILTVSIRSGQTVNEGTQMLQMSDPKALEVITSVIEEDYPLIQVGQSADLYFDATPGEEVTGRVDRIIPKRSSSERPLFTVYVTVEKVPDGVVEGMTADAAIILDQRVDVLRLPRALVQARSDNTAQVKLWMGNHKETRQVTIGLRGDVFIEILEGLEVGDQVVGQ